MKKIMCRFAAFALLGLLPTQALATQAFICSVNPTDEMDHPEAEISMIGEDTANAYVDADFSFMLQGKNYEGDATARKTENGFTVRAVDSKKCVFEYEFSRYKLPIPGEEQFCCNGRKKIAPMVRVWKECARSSKKIVLERSCYHHED